MGIANRKQQKLQIGVSKQQDNLYFVWLDELRQSSINLFKYATKRYFFPVIASFATKKQSMLFCWRHFAPLNLV